MIGHIAFYGSLNPGHGPFEALGLEDTLAFATACRIPGRLYDLGDYPGLIRGNGVVAGRLYRLLDTRVLRKLDDYEEIQRGRPKASLFLRRPVRLVDPAVTAWVYVYNRKPPPGTLVRRGIWSPDRL